MKVNRRAGGSSNGSGIISCRWRLGWIQGFWWVDRITHDPYVDRMSWVGRLCVQVLSAELGQSRRRVQMTFLIRYTKLAFAVCLKLDK